MGNRKLNAALHQVVLTQARVHPPARAYLAKKRAEGKSNKEAFRCLKRHLVRVVWRALREPLAAASGSYADARRPGSSSIDAKVCAPSASSRSPLP